MLRRLVILAALAAILSWCGVNSGLLAQNGVVKLSPYVKPADWDHWEVFVGLAAGFTVTGWDGTAWISNPNAPADWDGATNTLKVISATEPIAILGLTPGVQYYVRVVAVDTSNNRSAPSVEYNAVAGGTPRAAARIVAASNASPASKAGADYVCDGINDQVEINNAINDVFAVKGKVILTEGIFTITGSIYSCFILDLEGQGQHTIIKAADGSTEGTMIEGFVSDDVFIVKNLVLDGNRVASSTEYGIVARSGEATTIIENIIVKNVNVNGIALMFNTITMTNPVIRNCTITGCGSSAPYNEALFVGYVQDAFIMYNQIYDNSGDGICFEYCNNVICSNNQIRNNGLTGMRLLYSADNQITNNQLLGNGIAQDNTYANILLINDCHRNMIQGNLCRRGEASQQSKYGIRIESVNNTYNMITNNDCYQSGKTSGISNTGTNTSFGAGNRNNNGTWSTTPN